MINLKLLDTLRAPISNLRLGLLLVLSACLVLDSCNNPFTQTKTDHGTSSIQLEFSTNSSRTLVPDFAGLLAQVERFDISLTSQSGFDPRTVSFDTASGSMNINDLAWGVWDLEVKAYQAGTQILAGQQTGLDIGFDTTSINLALAPVNSGTGSMSYSFQFTATDGPDYVEASLVAGDGSIIKESRSVVLSADAGQLTGTYTETDLATGNYTLILDFKRGGAGGTSGGIFREALCIWSGVDTRRWLDPADGTAKAVRIYPTNSFFENNTNLASLEVFDHLSLALSTNISTNTHLGSITRGLAITFKPTASVAGQNLSYTWNGGPATSINSASTSDALGLKNGTNTLVLSILAPDGHTNRSVSYTMNWVSTSISSSSVAMEMVAVQSSTMDLGLNQYRSESINFRYRTPAHQVSLSDFMLGKYEVSQAQYLAIMGTNPSVFIDPLKPVQKVSYIKALEFCNKLSVSEGLEPVYKEPYTTTSIPDLSKNGYRLPTDAEWEYAARGGHLGGDGQAFVYAGSNDPDLVAVYNQAGGPNQVGSKAPNQLGLFDMSGNVLELTSDVINCIDAGSTNPQTYDFYLSYDPLNTPRDFVVYDVYEKDNQTSPSTFAGAVKIHSAGTAYQSRLRSTMGGAYNVGTSILEDISVASRLGVGLGVEEATVGFRVARSKRSLLRMLDIPGGVEPSTGINVPDFAMGATEVTQGQFEAVMGFVRTNFPGGLISSKDIPARQVSFYDALVFCNKLSAMEGFEPVYTLSGITGSSSITAATVKANFSKNGYRLPMLSERIWAVRGGQTSTYYWGETQADVSSFEWVPSNAVTYLANTVFMPVAQKRPNPYGLYDLAGNVFEWIWGSDTASEVPTRAGATVNAAGSLLATEMHTNGPGNGTSFYDNGFRVVRNKLNIRKTAYVTNYTTNTISAFTVNNNDTFTKIGDYACASRPARIAVSPDKRFLYVINILANNISCFRIQEDGSLVSLGANVPTGSSPYAMQIDPKGKFLYVTNTGSTPSTVSAYAIANDGKLEALSGSPFSVSTGVANFTLDQSGKYLVLAGRPAGTYGVGSYAIDASNGRPDFTLIGSSTIHNTGVSVVASKSNRIYAGTSSGYIGAATLGGSGSLSPINSYAVTDANFLNSLTLDPSNTYLFAAANSSSAGVFSGYGFIAVYTVDSASGVLTYKGRYLGTGAQNPNHLKVDNEGKRLYVCNYSSNDLTIFGINSDASLTEIQRIANLTNPYNIELLERL